MVEVENRFIEAATTRRHSAPGIASLFVPGLGQIMKGQFLTAIGIWVCMGVCLLLFFFGGLYFMAALWLAQTSDAFKSPDARTKRVLLSIGARRGWHR